MLFNSYIFILAFLPFTLVTYFLLNKLKSNRPALAFLAVMSLVFYGYFNVSYLLIICASICFNYIVSRLLYAEKFQKVSQRKLIAAIGIIFNVGLIFYFKYYDFFIQNMNSVFKTTFELKHILLPLGISFFTFQQISYVIDSYKGETKGYTFLEYIVFVTFFPQLIAGPIVLHDEMIPQFKDENNRKLHSDNLAHGLYMFGLGLFKKVLIADTFGKAVTLGFSDISALTAMDSLIVMLSYTIQIYFDFSGYCDMASGIALMFNIKLPMNFNSPYKATSIIDFWSRWHMTLTRFLRKYIYFPLGGSRKGTVRTCINIMIVFLVSGIWHGASWTFIVWGLLHGLAQVLTRLFKRNWEKLNVVTQWLFTFIFVNATWMIFRADSLKQGLRIVWRIVGCHNTAISKSIIDCFTLPEFNWLSQKWSLLNNIANKWFNGFFMWAAIIAAMFIIMNCKNCQEREFKPTVRNAILTIVLIFWSIMSLSGVSTFLYFNF